MISFRIMDFLLIGLDFQSIMFNIMNLNILRIVY